MQEKYILYKCLHLPFQYYKPGFVESFTFIETWTSHLSSLLIQNYPSET